MNTIYRKGICLLTAGIASFLLTACSSDDDRFHVPGAENFTRDMIVGEWFEPAGDGAYGVGEYRADGTLTSTLVHATGLDWMHSTDEGYWEYSDGLLTVVTNISHAGVLSTNTKAVYQVVKLTKYDIEDSGLDMDLISGGHRIVDTYRMNVGETRQAIVNDSEFKPQEYSSVSYHVAGVDDEGTIEARHLGTTYILIKSSIGTAVIRVVVSDSDNDFNDALPSLGVPVQTISKEYGQLYVELDREDGTKVRRYYLADEKVTNIRMILDSDGYVKEVYQYFSNYITPDEVRASLNRKYDFQYSDVDSNGERVDWYIANWQCRMVAVGYFEKSHEMKLYFLSNDDNLQLYDNFFSRVMINNITLWEVAYNMDYYLTDDDYARGSFLAPIYDYPFRMVEASTDEQGYVNKVYLYFEDKISVENVEYYLKRYYLPTNVPYIYFSTDYSYYIAYSADEDGYLNFLQYSKRNTN